MTRPDAVLAWVKGPDVLDVGCTDHVVSAGQSTWMHGRLRERFPEAWGIDIDEDNLSKMRSAGYKNLVNADAQNFDLDRRFDTIVAGELIEHVGNPAGFLESARRHLKPGGRLVLTTPNPFALLNVLYAWLKYPQTCSNAQHVAWFCPQTLRMLAERTDFRVAHWQLLMDTPPTESRKWNTLVRVLRVVAPALPGRVRYNDMLFVLAPAPEA